MAEISKEFQDWKRKVESCKDRRVKWEAKVATCMHFEAGNHKVWWDDNGLMRQVTQTDNEAFRAVNMFPRALGTIVARMIANDPRWNPSKSQLADVTDEEVDAADAALQDIWEGDEFGDYGVKQEMKIVIRHGYLQGGRLVYFRFDQDSDMPVMDSFELWDTFSDEPEKLKDKQWLVIACTKGVEWVKNNEAFNAEVRKQAESDNRLAESGLKQQFVKWQSGSQKQNSLTVYYAFSVVKDGEGRKIKFQIICPYGVLQEETIDYPRLSAIFDIYKPVEDGKFYSDPPAHSWIDPNRAIDKTLTNIENYMDTFLHGRWVLRDRNVAKPVAGRGGQVIYDQTGSAVTQLQLQPLPNTSFMYKSAMDSYFQYVAGVHNVSVGGSTAGAESGVAIAQVSAADENNSADPVDNYKMFLKRCAKKLLRQMSDNWEEVHTVYRFDSALQDKVPMKVAGSKFVDAAAEGQEEGVPAEMGKVDYTDVVKIHPFRRVDVDIEAGAFFKQSEKRAQIVELMKAGWTPGGNAIMDKIILSGFTIGVGREVVRELKQAKNPYYYIVQGNIILLLQGQQVPINENDPHQFYWNTYTAAAEEQLKAGNQQGARLLTAQAKQHAILMQSQGGAPSPELPKDLAELEGTLGGEA